MSEFSSVLKSYIADMGLKIQSLAKTTGVDRTLIQKMIKGERVPADMQIVEKLVSAMMLTPQQEEEIYHLYHIARMGEEVYSRHMLVKNLVERFAELPTGSHQLVKTAYLHDFDGFPDAAAANGVHEVNAVIKAIIETEIANPEAKIKIIAQPDYEFLIELITILGNQNTNLTIEHTFCLQKSIHENNENIYNLNCMKQIAPLLVSGCKYIPYIYYDDVKTHINDTSIFPFMILTSDRVISITYDLSNATIFRDANIMGMYTAIYEGILKISKPLVTRLDNMLDNFKYYTKMEQQKSKILSHILMSQPCMNFFLNDELISKYIIPDIPFLDELINLNAFRASYYGNMLEKDNRLITYFTKSGVDGFIKSGRINEITPKVYTPIEREDCLFLVKQIKDNEFSENYNPILIDENKFKIPDNLMISSLDESTIGFIYINPKYESMYFTINEKSLAQAIHSFLVFLEESDMVYSKEKTFDFIKSRVE